MAGEAGLPRDPAMRREAKIKQYKREKELREQISVSQYSHLAVIRTNPRHKSETTHRRRPRRWSSSSPCSRQRPIALASSLYLQDRRLSTKSCQISATPLWFFCVCCTPLHWPHSHRSRWNWISSPRRRQARKPNNGHPLTLEQNEHRQKTIPGGWIEHLHHKFDPANSFPVAEGFCGHSPFSQVHPPCQIEKGCGARCSETVTGYPP